MAATINQKKSFQAMTLQNPFTLKMGQVFTSFALGCGIGIGCGKKLGTAHDILIFNAKKKKKALIF